MSAAASIPTVGITVLAGRSLLEITGADRAGLLHNFCTNDIKKLAVGAGCEAFITSHQGKTLGYVLVFAHESSLWLDTAPGQAEKLIAHLDRFVITERVEFQNRTAAFTDILVLGPQASEILATLFSAALPAEMLAWGEGEFAGVKAVIRRVPWSNEPSYFLQVCTAEQQAVVEALVSHRAVSLSAEIVESERILAQFPAYGADVTDDNLPQEIAREPQTISFKKGCYLGQETVARLDALGHVNRLLVRLRIFPLVGSRSVPPVGTELMLTDKSVGKITSVANSGGQQGVVALAYVKRLSAAAGTKLTFPGGEAEVLPKLDPSGN